MNENANNFSSELGGSVCKHNVLMLRLIILLQEWGRDSGLRHSEHKRRRQTQRMWKTAIVCFSAAAVIHAAPPQRECAHQHTIETISRNPPEQPSIWISLSFFLKQICLSPGVRLAGGKTCDTVTGSVCAETGIRLVSLFFFLCINWEDFEGCWEVLSFS